MTIRGLKCNSASIQSSYSAVIRARAIIEAETPKKAFRAVMGLDGFFQSRGFRKANLWTYIKQTDKINIYVRRLSGGGGRVWQLVVEVPRPRSMTWGQVENTLHDMASLRHAVEVYDNVVTEAESPKKVFRQAANKARQGTASAPEHEEFLSGYVAAALWSSHDDRYPDENLEGEELAPATEERMRVDCLAFLNDNYERIKAGTHSMAHAGGDFWLSRCGHGCGFFDGGYGGHEYDLQDAARAWGNIDLYVGDDGLVYET
jgi:hypothetical protein